MTAATVSSYVPVLFALAAFGIAAAAVEGWKLRVVMVLSAMLAVVVGVPEVGEMLRAPGTLGLPDALGTVLSALPLVIAACLLSVAIAIMAERMAGDRAGDVSRVRDEAAANMRASEARQLRLRGLLKKEHEKLETVHEMHRYFELATRNSQITVFYQDADLRYRWIVNPRSVLTPATLLGGTDDGHLPENVHPLVVGHKRRALETKSTQTFEIELPSGGERFWFRVDVVPISEGAADPTGIVCTAIDITRSKRLDMMRTDLSRRLAETLQRFNLALRSERIMVFSQDTSLRYTWANSDETQVGTVIGRTDDDVLPEADREPIKALKQKVIDTRRPASKEVGVGDGSDRRWYDLHVEPNLRPDGTVSGITCAAIDITHRKRNEEQMRLVMRELTHRTKNLLAVVIAIARQTALQSSSIDAFVPALIARLRALSAAQDLIVADDWAGVELAELVKLLVSQYVPVQSGRVAIDGPEVVLSPEAAQNLGLAVHELVSNAVQYGAFANPTGRLSVTWWLEKDNGRDAMRIEWVEAGGPAVTEPTRRGFGTMVIERNLARALNADVDLRFDSTGLTASIRLPMDGVTPLISPDRAQLAKVG